MDLISTAWSCARCGAGFISTPPSHGLCGQCSIDPQTDTPTTAANATPCDQPTRIAELVEEFLTSYRNRGQEVTNDGR